MIDQKKLVERLFAVLNMLKNSFFVAGAVLGIAAVVLIAVTVRWPRSRGARRPRS